MFGNILFTPEINILNTRKVGYVIYTCRFCANLFTTKYILYMYTSYNRLGFLEALIILIEVELWVSQQFI